jgi:hypothetical protein
MESHTFGMEFENKMQKKEIQELVEMLRKTSEYKDFADKYKGIEKGLRLVS